MADDLPELIRKVEELQRMEERKKGEMDQIVKRLKKEFKCKTIKEAKVLLTRGEESERKIAVKCTEVKAALVKKHRKVLE